MTTPLEFRAGMWGALAPFALFLSGVTWLALSGAPDERGFWPVLVAALTLGLLLSRDRTRYCETVLTGMGQPIVMIMIMAWLLAGALGAMLAASGVIEGLVWAARAASLQGVGFVVATFAACALISTSTGTSFGTMLVAGPLLYPAGVTVGAPPAVLLGAIIGGATFGDSISPVSDTTIASAGTQGADIGGVVRSRLKYVLPAAALAVVALAILASNGERSLMRGTSPTSSGSLSPRGLPMLLVPALVLVLLLTKRHLLEGLLMGILATAMLGAGLGLLPLSRMVYIDHANFAAKGVIVDGMNRGVGAAVFTILLVGLVAALQATGAIDRMVTWTRRGRTGARATEWGIVGSVSAAVLLTTHSIVAMLAVGEMAKEAGEVAGISAYRRANLLDMTVCTWPFLLPYCIPTILAASITNSAAAAGVPRVSALQAGLYNTYSWALLVAIVVAVGAGYGRDEGRTPGRAGNRE